MLSKLIFGGVVSATLSAFHSIRMEPCGAVEPAVVAFNVEREFFLHWMRVYQRINGCIVLLQLVRWQHGFPAQRTAQPVLLKATQLAMRVHGMPARQHGCRFDRME
jgi:hypothetical protein